MPRPLWLHIDGGLQIAMGDYVLTEDVNADPGSLLLAKSDYTARALAAPGSYIHSPESQTNISDLSFLRSASENGRPALLKIEMVDPGGVEGE